MSSIFTSDTNISPPPEISLGLGKDNKSFIFLMFIIVIIVVVIVIVPWDKLNKKREEMSGGTVAQMFAQDSQDVYLKGNVDKIATGNFDLYWNQPTRQGMNVFQNRGYPLYSILLPDTPMNPTSNIKEVSNNYVDNIIDNEVYKKENKLNFTNPVLKLDNVLPSKINSLTNDDKPEQTDYLTFPKTFDTTKSTKSIKSTKSTKSIEPTKPTKSTKTTKSIRSIPIIPKNVLPSSLPIDIVANSNPYELSEVAKQVAKTKKTTDNLPALTQWTPENYLFQAYTDRSINNRDCIKDPASCTYGTFGGARLNDAFVQPTKAVPNVNLDGNYYYPDSYVGTYFTQPNFDIVKPYPFVPDANKV